MSGYVCASRGRLESYQVPFALAEGEVLDCFVTDVYATPIIRNLLAKSGLRGRFQKLASRYVPQIPDNRVKCLWSTTFLEHLRHQLGYASSETYLMLDRQFSLGAAKAAAKKKSHLLLHHPYAWEAFNTKYNHNPRKILWQYHPHPEVEHRILEEDRRKYPGFGESFGGATQAVVNKALATRERDIWRLADLVICTSSFTRRTLVELGCDDKVCRTVPYGVNFPVVQDGEPANDRFDVVFVGSGGQRKGLHHLLLAWQQANLPPSSRLTLVCRVLDKGIEELIGKTPNVVLRRGVNETELHQLYARSTLFAMPSLVEGFGQVYLEAMAQGCPVLGTANTCLPDIGTEAEGVFLTPPGNVEALIDRLEVISRQVIGNSGIRSAAKARAAKFTWPLFREKVRQTLK